MNLIELEFFYQNVKNKRFTNRYIKLDDFYNFIDVHITDKQIIGYSTNNNPIFIFKKGITSNKKILIWSQMHGNETTGTLAMLDLWNILENNKENALINNLLKKYEIHYIPIVNPDGAQIWSRENAVGIDINRDFNSQKSEEIKILKNQFTNVNYCLGFNLHDQRNIFSTGNTNYPATLSFLSPAVDYNKTLTKVRMKSMGIISFIYDNLQMYIPHQISRYSDEFYPNAIGDNFQKLGLPTVLFEAGHFLNDFNRTQTRKYFFFALIYALKFLLKEDCWEKNYENYFKIPNNSASFVDVVVESARFNLNGKIIITDFSIQYQEHVNNSKFQLEFLPVVNEIGDLCNKKRWKTLKGKDLPIFQKPLKIGEIMNYEFFYI